MANELKNIQHFLQQVTGAFAAVVDVELGIIDRDLEVIAGTGFYEKQVGVVYSKGCMTERIIPFFGKKCTTVRDTRSSDDCRRCLYFEQCDVLAFLMCPICYQEEVIGTLSMLALNDHQRRKLIQEQVKLSQFLSNLCSFIVIALNEKQMGIKVNSLAKQIRAVVNSVHEGLIAINEDGYITNINQSACSILEFNDDMLHRDIGDLFPGLDSQELLREAGSTAVGQVYERELKYPGPGGSELWLYCNISLMYENGRATGAVLSFRKKEEIKRLASRIIGEEKKHTFDAIKGTSTELIEIKKKMKQVANTDSTILIYGETGTGKSLFARAIHERSYRKDKPFITVNCAAIPAALLESELFGYEEGAFTGAKKGGKPGKFEIAHEGTLFLDEIGDMPLSSQIKLLHVIETKIIDRIGGIKSKAVDVRIIAATNQDLEALIERGEFRSDLFYRLNVIPFYIPSLRERADDIPLLMYHFLDYYSILLNKSIRRFEQGAKEVLCDYPWPGNIRELENAIEYAVNIETGEQITLESLPWKIFQLRQRTEELPQLLSINHLEKNAILKALHKYGATTAGKEDAAAALGISRATLYRKLKEYRISSS